MNYTTIKSVIPIFAAILLLQACGGENKDVNTVIESNDIEQIRKKRETIAEELKGVEAKMALLDSAILALDDNAKLPLVTTMTAEAVEFKHYLDLYGEVTTDQNVLVFPEMSGTLLRVHVKKGQKVGKGQILASIDDGGLSSQLAQLKTQEELARTTYERQKRLWDQNIGSEIQFLQAKAQFEAQEAAVKQLEKVVGKSSIRAPFTGIVDEVIKDQGTVVSPGPGSEVFRIVNLSDMYVEVEVPEAHLDNVRPGKSVEVMFPVLGERISTKIRQAGNFINPGNRSFTVEIPVPNQQGKIKPNLTAIAKINDYTNDKAILVPQSVVSENAAGEQFVYLADGNDSQITAKKVIIETGKSQGDVVEVTAGLSAGDKIIVEGARSVRHDQQIKVLELTENKNS